MSEPGCRKTWVLMLWKAMLIQDTWAPPASSPRPSQTAAGTTESPRFQSWDGIPDRQSGKCEVEAESPALPRFSALLASFSLSGSPVSVDYLVIRPIQGLQCDMSSSFVKHWKKRSTVDVGHRGAGSSHAAKWVMKKRSQGAAFTFNITSPLTSCLASSRHHRIRENTIASFQSAAKHVGLRTDITHWLWQLCSGLWLS